MRGLVLLVLPVLLLAGCAGLSPGVAAYNAGVEHAGRGEKDLAEQQYKLALQAQPDLAEAHMNLGLVYSQSGLWEAAEAEAQQSIRIFERTKTTVIAGATFPQSLSLAYSNLGAYQLTLALQAAVKGDSARAQQLQADAAASIRKAVELDPSNVRAQSSLKNLPAAAAHP